LLLHFTETAYLANSTLAPLALPRWIVVCSRVSWGFVKLSVLGETERIAAGTQLRKE